MKMQKSEITDLVTLVVTAIVGGGVSSYLLNMPKAADGVTPSISQTMRALGQLFGGAIIAVAVPGKGAMKFLKVMGAGTAVAGGLDLVENVMSIKMLAGKRPRKLTPEMIAYIRSGGRLSGPAVMRQMAGPAIMRQMGGNPAFMGRSPAPQFMGHPGFQFKSSN